jgi:hypothetical protein
MTLMGKKSKLPAWIPLLLRNFQLSVNSCRSGVSPAATARTVLTFVQCWTFASHAIAKRFTPLRLLFLLIHD